MAAYGCLRAITTLLDSVANQKALLPALEASLLPLMTHFLSSSGQDVFEDVLEILAFFTYYPETISPQLWGLWPRLQVGSRNLGACCVLAPCWRAMHLQRHHLALVVQITCHTCLVCRERAMHLHHNSYRTSNAPP